MADDERPPLTDSKPVAQRWSEEGKARRPALRPPARAREAEDFERRLIDALAYELARLNCRLDVTLHSVRIPQRTGRLRRLVGTVDRRRAGSRTSPPEESGG